ncbi:iron-sulfur cluster assembly accessory protein [Xanthobacter dioxanivorans]|uniref:Iron-sulfur cluster assembly accessory protein n=1 Tax=Xanthobacter dioxanivorans TaxID=2528964 RepID=A0A974PLU0_9HYPH|nr:iron-sulfur cluster assembly accessory protein [Xanthobacter dioxanivorans]QRG05983.1 iron-sulfur cluster assembly accessory protein [Xanthobacter dioxanivorans]
MSLISDPVSKPAPKRSLPPVIRITDAAAERLREILSGSPEPGTAVRVGVENGGCAGMSYKLDTTTEVGPLDAIVEDKGVRVVVDAKAVLFLLGTEMDFRTDKVSSQFVFNNPNQTSSCGCGESVSITPATAG